MDGNGGCCIARWTDGGHVSAGYDMTKTDRIMLRFRPIAPKPVAAYGTVATALDSGATPDGRHAKAAGRGRRKSDNKENNNNTTKRCNNGRKRKSSSPDQTVVSGPHDDQDQDKDQNLKGVVTLLPLFPEAPDLSPRKQAHHELPIWWLNFDNNSPVFEDNYGQCHGGGW